LVGVVVAALVVVAIAPLYIADRNLAQSYATTNPHVALTAVERAQKFSPADPYLPQREAELATQIGDWSRAKDAYHRSIRLNPEHFAPYELMASFYERRGESEKALSLYRKALALNPLDKQLHREVAQLTAGTTHGEPVEDTYP
jgi:tetratricopeptide (TPR) repeat protein